MQYRFTPSLTFRTIDAAGDADVCAAHHYDACVASFGEDCRYEGRDAYVRWLGPRAEEFPEGFVLAFDGPACVGQLELEVPYGRPTGYVNLFYVAPEARGRGVGQLLHDYAELYFRNWEARRVELHVSPRNIRAIRFYRRRGYAFSPDGDGTYMTSRARLWKMSKAIEEAAPSSSGT